MVHIPILRAGKPYKSLNLARVTHIKTGAPLAMVSQANRGLIAKDLCTIAESKRALEALSVSELLEICQTAAHLFMESDLPLDGDLQSPNDYVCQVSGTTGMPEALCRRNMQKIRLVLEEMEVVLGGLTRGLELTILDSGWGIQNKRPLSYVRQTEALGAVLPSNSPGVHSLWLPAIPLKVPLVLKPGGEEPWTPFRIAQAVIAAGCPPEAFGFYPTDYSGAAEILLRCGRSLLFGGESTVAPWKANPGVQIHGPGQSKIIIAADQISQWEDYLDLMVASVAENGGRSCINASGVWVPTRGREIATALAERLAQIEARPLDDPDAQIAAFTNPKFAHQLSSLIDNQLKVPGATDVTAEFRGGERVVEKDGCTFLTPTVIWCEDPEHSLANAEFLFPFVSVVEVPQREILERIGPTLVVTAITEDENFIEDLLDSPDVERLNLGPISTNQISWDQPHEGNLFEHLYRQRALQMK
ncbi:MAG: aldehyde dehydrogenase family protein [Candidatus Poribacteria bacterium]|nr:aldehyde dehydrogenase family protein [Candidatus Poribacteria bacterium]